MADIDLTPTEEMAANAKRGLELRRKHGRGGTAVGVARARDISNRKTLSPETVRRMHAFFSRHEKNKAGGEDDAGYIAWLLWGGDSGQGWAKRKVEQMDKSENQRSETYKAIAERLGSAATNDRPGAKARMAMSVNEKAMLVAHWNSVSKLLKEARDRLFAAERAKDEAERLKAIKDIQHYSAQRDAATATLKREGLMSRPGAKARMAKWTVTPTQKHGKDIEEHTAKIGRDHWKIDSMPHLGKSVGSLYRWDEMRGLRHISTGNIEQLKRQAEAISTKQDALSDVMRGFSRPGAKASFAQDARAVAQEILRQLGGGRFMAMVGGKNAMHGTFGGKPGLQVSIGKGAEGGINRLIVTLDPATDTYNMEFWRIGNRGLSTKKVSEASGVYADDLQRVFTDRTKFYTSMSRSSAKTEMAAIDAGMMDGAGNEVVIRMADGSRATARYNRGTGKWSLEGHADVPAFAKVRDLVAHLTKQGMSRPGAKAKMGKQWREGPYAFKNKLLAEDQMQLLVNEGSGWMNAGVFMDESDTIEASKSYVQMRKRGFVYEHGQWNKARASRPGAKAKMAISVEEAEKIIATIKQRREAATEWIPALDHLTKQRNFAQRLIVAHRKRDTANIKRYSDLLEKAGWSRPGAKAVMGYADAQVSGGEIVWPSGMALKILKRSTLEEKSPQMQEAIKRNKSAWVADYQLRGPRGATYTLDVYSNGTYILTPHNNPGAAMRGKLNASRPGAKDTNAVREGCKISAEDEACLKMMAAADEKVSGKIRTLIAEGKPQKQAVAIALDLKRRGEL